MPEPRVPDSYEAQLARALHAPLSAVEPERRFAVRLRARLERALTLTKGEVKMEVTPYLAVAGARRALAWYGEVFGATPRGEQILGEDGEVHHAELDFGGALVMLAEESPGIYHTAPRPGSGSSVSIHLQVPEVDTLVIRAQAAGAIVDRQPSDNPYGRMAVLRDPFGHRWMLMSALAERELAARSPAGAAQPGVPASAPGQHSYGTLSDCTDDQGMRFHLWEPTEQEARAGAVVAAGMVGGLVDRPLNGTRHGDLSYLTLKVRDSERFRAFFGEVLGWSFFPGHATDGWGIAEPMPMHGVAGGAETPTAVPMWRVDDIAAAVELVRSLGGTASPIERHPYGLSATCTDDQGTAFYLHQL